MSPTSASPQPTASSPPEGVDVAYRVLETPVAPLLVAVGAGGVLRTAFDVDGLDGVLDELTEGVGPIVVETEDGTEEAARQLDEYFAGRRRHFELPLDLRGLGRFQEQVVRHLAEIPYGTTQSYGEVAAALGRPRAMRAVGTACSRNPVPVLLPCHRVVRSDGTVGGYMGGQGVWIKTALLELERA